GVAAHEVRLAGDGGGVWSWVHIWDAAAATTLALEHEGPAIYNIVDDEPAPTSVWLPELARIIAAKPPLRLPRLLAQLLAGDVVVVMAKESRGASNDKAKQELDWTLRYPSWRQGFRETYGPPETLKSTAPCRAQRAAAGPAVRKQFWDSARSGRLPKRRTMLCWSPWTRWWWRTK